MQIPRPVLACPPVLLRSAYLWIFHTANFRSTYLPMRIFHAARSRATSLRTTSSRFAHLFRLPYLAIALLCVGFLTGHLQAQPTLTALQLPQAGDLVVQDWMNTVPLQSTTTGPNQVWDHSLSTFNALEDSGRYVNMTSTYPGWFYNFGYKFISPTQPKYEFYQLASNYLRYAGYARADIAIDTLVLSTPSMILPVPITYGDSLVEPITGNYVNSGFPISLSGSTHLKADAYGTVILPWATYNNVLRVHVLDTLSLFGQNQTNSAYYYYDTSERYPILVIFENSTPIGYTTRLGIPTSVETASFATPPRLYPNPASDRLFLEMPSYSHAALTVELLDLRGQAIRTWQLKPGTGYETTVLNVADVSGGLYVLQIISQKSGTWRKKVYIRQE